MIVSKSISLNAKDGRDLFYLVPGATNQYYIDADFKEEHVSNWNCLGLRQALCTSHLLFKL